ncbi:MAG TPA: nucleotidyltransferase family protein [Polyangia bacterium]|jgi:hypothetical protein
MTPPDRDPVRAALIRCAKAAAWSARAPALEPLPALGTLVEAARAQHALAIVGRTLRALPDCPEPLRFELERIDRGTWATHVVTSAALGPVLAAAATTGIRVVAYKGAALAARWYDEPWTRAMSDVDVLVSPTDEARFHALLNSSGFTIVASPLGRSWSARASHERTFSPGAPGARLLDVHTAPAPPARYRFVVAEMIARARPGVLFDAPVHLLTPEDELLVMAANQAYDHFRFGLLRFLDAWLLTERSPIDWGLLIDTAHRAGAATAAWLTLSNARRIADVHVSDDVLARLRPSAPRRAWLRALLDTNDWGEPRLPLPRRIEQALLVYPTVDRSRDFVRFVTFHGRLRALDAWQEYQRRFRERRRPDQPAR